MLSIIIPSVGESTLQKTVDDIRNKAKGETEIIVVFDNVRIKEIQGAICVSNPNKGMRSAINYGVSISKGEHILKIDEHCIVGEGFDEILLADLDDNWVVCPRRLWLDIKKWEIMDVDRLPADYERLLISHPEKIGGCRWDSRTVKRKDILIDDNMVFQGSFYLMSRKHWDWLGGLHSEGYGEFANEAVEICLKTWLGGGRVITNKKTWYAHKHRSFGRYSKITSLDTINGNLYSRDYWLNNRWENRKHDLNWLMDKFGLKTC
jgi:glycosyltransferase involved in cell wall biosynthesis